MLFGYALTSFSSIARSHCRAVCSPSSLRIAVTNDSNDGLVGAHPTRPFHSGSGTL